MYQDGDDDIRRPRPKKSRPDQVGMLLNHEDEADESEIDPGHSESQYVRLSIHLDHDVQPCPGNFSP